MCFTMKQRRRAWFKHLLKTRFKDDRAAFMKETGYTKGRVAQFLNPKQAFGERASRELASRIKGLNEDYFENPAWPADSNPIEARIIEMTTALREIHALDPQRFESVDANLTALVQSLKATDQILRESHGITGYVKPARAEETLGKADKRQPPPTREALIGGASGFGGLDETPASKPTGKTRAKS